MKAKFFDVNRIPENYKMIWNEYENLIVVKDGRQYQSIGFGVKNYHDKQARWIGIRAIIKVFLTVGIALFFERVRDDFSVAFTGKRVVKVYQLRDFTSKQRNSTRAPISESVRCSSVRSVHCRIEHFINSFDLLKKAFAHYKTEKVIRSEELQFEFSPKANSPREKFSELLAETQGFCIGESHNEKLPKDILIKEMPFLKRQGVKVLFMEQFYTDMQNDLDRFQCRRAIPTSITNNLNNSNYSYGYLEVVQAAKKEGIQVVAIDHKLANISDSRLRNAAMNYVAFQIMKKTISQMDNGKFVALMGSNHARDIYAGVPGVPHLLECPKIVL